MKREELIKSLLEQDLNQFRFGIWATFNEEDELEYAYCLKGSKPAAYQIHLLDIGGNPDTQYTYDFLYNELIECKYNY